jgi:head-tail adaptor
VIGVGRRLNRTLEVRRPTTVPDGTGGRATVFVRVGEVRAKVDRPGASDRGMAGRTESLHTHTVYLLPDADVARGDELHGGGQVLHVHHVHEPSSPNYRRADCELTQTEGSP